MRHIRLALLLASSFTCSQAATPPPDEATPDSASTVPAFEELFDRPRFRYYTLSPDGRFMVEIFESRPPPEPEGKDRKAMRDWWLRSLVTPDQEIWLTDFKTRQYRLVAPGLRGVRASRLRWIDSTSFLWHVYVGDRWSIERVRLKINEDGSSEIGEVQNLGPGYLVGLLPGEPLRMLVSGQDGGAIGIFRVDPTLTLKAQMVDQNRVAGPYNGLEEAAFDATGAVRALSVWRRFGDKRLLFRATPEADWTTVYTAPHDPWRSLELVGFDDRNGMLQVVTDFGSDRRVLRELDPRTGQLGRTLYDDGRNDVTSAYSLDTTGRVTTVIVNDNAFRIEHLDPELAAMQRKVAGLIPGYEPKLLTVSKDRSRAIVFTGESNNPGKYSLYEAAGGKLLLMEHVMPGLKGRQLARSEPISLTARDGLRIHGQYTPPVPPQAKPPVVVVPHGGPFGVRDYSIYDPEVQFLAARGYGVLQVDFRGSGGYGRDFLKAGFGRWGREMQDDIADALRWLIASGRVDGERACIYGGSYGGYAAVMGVIRYPELFRCGATIAGVSDLSLMQEGEDFRNDPWVRSLLREVIGDPELEKASLQRNSPAFLAREIKRPLFIAHGGRDTRVDPEHAWRLRAAVEASGGKPEWLLLEDEGHALSDPEARKLFYGKLAEFLHAHLQR